MSLHAARVEARVEAHVEAPGWYTDVPGGVPRRRGAQSASAQAAVYLVLADHDVSAANAPRRPSRGCRSSSANAEPRPHDRHRRHRRRWRAAPSGAIVRYVIVAGRHERAADPAVSINVNATGGAFAVWTGRF